MNGHDGNRVGVGEGPTGKVGLGEEKVKKLVKTAQDIRKFNAIILKDRDEVIARGVLRFKALEEIAKTAHPNTFIHDIAITAIEETE